MSGRWAHGDHPGDILEQNIETRLLVGATNRPKLTEMRHRLQIQCGHKSGGPNGSNLPDAVAGHRILQQTKHILLGQTDRLSHGISHLAMAPDHLFIGCCLSRVQG